MNRYIYDGPVLEFDRVISSNWHGETMANSLYKAKSNLSYRFKKETGRISNSKITLPGEMKVL